MDTPKIGKPPLNAVLAAFAALAMLLMSVASHAAPVRLAQVTIPGLIGEWSLRWEGSQDNYTGTLTVVRRAGDNLYMGTLVLRPGKGGVVTQDVRVSSSGSELRIEGSNPRVTGRSSSSWDPDRFFVVKEGTRMEGYSLDAAGRRGPRIVFTKLD